MRRLIWSFGDIQCFSHIGVPVGPHSSASPLDHWPDCGQHYKKDKRGLHGLGCRCHCLDSTGRHWKEHNYLNGECIRCGKVCTVR